MGSLGVDEGGVSRGKSYGCKFCGMVFSDGRVLGGHVRSHMAAAGLGRRSKKLAIDPGECSEGDGGERSRGERCGYGLRENRKKSWKFSGESEERRECSPRGKNQCGVCERGFRTSRALLGHMRLHSRKGRRVEGSGRREICCSDTETSVEEVMSDYKRICLANRSLVRARRDAILPGKKGMSLSSFLSGGTPGDEFEAAICLLMISRGVRDSENSDAVNKVWENISTLVYTEDESDGSESSELEVGNKRKRVGDMIDAAAELQEVSRCVGSFLTLLNLEGKLIGSDDISFNIESRGIEVQSHQKDDIVEIKHLGGDLEPESSVLDDLGGECEKKLLPDSDTGKYHVPPKKLKEGYKCKSCGKMFAIHQALGGHRAKFKNGSCLTVEKNESGTVNGKYSSLPSPPKDEVVQMASVAEAALTEPDHKCPTCGKVFSSGQALGGHKRMHYKKGSSSMLSKKSDDDMFLEV